MGYVESEKDIAVVIDNKLTFDKHISEKINKANLIMGVLCRTMEYIFMYIDCTTFTLLHTAPARPHLEYANQVRCAYLNMAVQSLNINMYSCFFFCVYMYLCMSPIISIIVLNCLPLVGP